MATDKQSFFLPGECADPQYRAVRDEPRLVEGRAFVDSLWSRYHDLADRHCRENARNDFLARFWEMYLAVTLRERGFKLERVGNEGPEFYFLHKDRKVWVEAIAPRPGEGKDRVPDYRYGKWIDIQTEQILFRFTNALDKKREKYNEALKKNIIKSDDLYLLAINSRGIPHAQFGNPMPLFIQAFLPFGNLTFSFETKPVKIVDSFYQHREEVVKASGAPVSTTAFLEPAFSFVSAVLHSAVHCVNHLACLGEDFSILHNPTALHPLDSSAFHWCEQMFYRDGTLERRPCQ